MTESIIILEGNPISTSHVYHQTGKVRYMTAKSKALKADYQWQAKSQWEKPILTQKLSITVDLFFKNKLIRDWDNWHKLSMDALTGIVWEDDSQIEEATVRKHLDKERPRIEIRIKEHIVDNIL